MPEQQSDSGVRRSGILLPVASLPAPAGIGNLGSAARSFVDFLSDCGQSVWQILPLQIPDDAHSPYASPSAFAGYPLLIDPADLVEDGLLSRRELRFPPLHVARIQYRQAEANLTPLLRRAWASFRNGGGEKMAEYRQFCREQWDWLPDFAQFAAVQATGRRRIRRDGKALRAEVRYQIFLQYLFERQCAALRAYRKQRGILLCGDIPFYVARRSADVQRHPAWFDLSSSAGVPPDAFSASGQRWGNPTYRWDKLAEDGFSFWIRRLARCADLYDITRLDHFRALDSYYAIPFHARDARHGEWRRGPGASFLRAVRRALPSLSLVAEDLGQIPPSVRKLRAAYGIPGMRVLQFAFGEGAEQDFLPHRYERNTFVYLGTHDNDTTAGFWQHAPEFVRRHAAAYLGFAPDAETNVVVRHMMKAAAASVADTVIYTLQDISCRGSAERINTPSARAHCWEYAAPAGWAEENDIEFLQNITRLYGRWNTEGNP